MLHLIFIFILERSLNILEHLHKNRYFEGKYIKDKVIKLNLTFQRDFCQVSALFWLQRLAGYIFIASKFLRSRLINFYIHQSESCR